MNEEIFWKAFSTNDPRFDGVFFTGVTSTGIYCRPSCTARLPKRENVLFFDTQRDAESKGFRACLRCRPKESSADPQVETVVRACRLLESEDRITLEELGAELNLSPSHLQRTFKEITGVSPRQYAEAIRLGRFKSGVRKGSDVASAMYDAGYGSSSRLYEKASENLGMTPAVYRKGGKGMKINYTIADCELGKMLVARTKRGVCAVTFGDNDDEMVANLVKEYPQAEIEKDDAELKNTVAEILKYLSGKNRRLVLPLDLQATAFQIRVWDFLRQIPYGETMSYSEIAEKLGDRKKTRAVAQACARNRVAVVIPCHRVVAGSGELSGYRWGVERKKKLLEKEKANL